MQLDERERDRLRDAIPLLARIADRPPSADAGGRRVGTGSSSGSVEDHRHD
jgi:hypothetical protein